MRGSLFIPTEEVVIQGLEEDDAEMRGPRSYPEFFRFYVSIGISASSV